MLGPVDWRFWGYTYVPKILALAIYYNFGAEGAVYYNFGAEGAVFFFAPKALFIVNFGAGGALYLYFDLCLV